MFTPKYVKQGKFLLKGVRKFVRYKRDVMAPEKVAAIEEARGRYERALADRDKELAEAEGKRLTKLCEGSVPAVEHAGIRENLEVIFVAVVIAVGIRSYFLQPFKIPTGSMQPTLNGINGYAQYQIVPAAGGGVGGASFTVELDEQPNFLQQAFEFVWRGRNYVHAVAPKDDRILAVGEATRFRFFTFTYLQMASGDTVKIYAPAEVVVRDLGLGDFFNRQIGYSPGGVVVAPSGAPVREGQLLAYGYIDTGDQVLVDKVSYHFRRPDRGEVFVFNTRGILGIENGHGFDPLFGSQHYIKRLAGVPGDRIEVREPELWINGARAEGEGFDRVMSRLDGYQGYQDVTGVPGKGQPMNIRESELESDQYFAMGDNSYHSFDSRMWGPVPEKNLVGPALVVYWPFAPHWGTIE